MANIGELDKKLNDAILSGKALEAFDELYADDVVMQENTDAGTGGKDFNRKREEEFFATVEAFHDGRVLAAARPRRRLVLRVGDGRHAQGRGPHQDDPGRRPPLEERQDRSRALLSQVIATR